MVVRLLLVGSLLIIAPIVGFCNYSMCCCVLLCAHSSFAIIEREETASCFVLFVFLVSSDSCVALPHDVMGLSAVSYCGFFYPTN